jgi:hypothetical protein
MTTVAKFKRKEGAPSPYDPLVYPRQAEVMYSIGALDKDVAAFFGVTRKCVEEWGRRYKEFGSAIQNGRDAYHTKKIERCLRERATGYEYEEVTIREIKIKQGKGQASLPAIEKITVKKKVPPDVTAIMFFLQNRHAARWKNVRYSENNVNVRGDLTTTERKELMVDLRGMTKGELELLRPIIERQAAEAQSKDASERSDASAVALARRN